MKFKNLAVASAIAVASASSFAAPGDVIATGSFANQWNNPPVSFAAVVAGLSGLGAYNWEVSVTTTGLTTLTDIMVNGGSNAPSGPKFFMGSGTGNDTFDLKVFASTTGKEGNWGGSYTLTAAIPEPETYALMLAGLGAIGFMASRRRKG